MRVVCGVLAVLLVLFAAAQLNDPDVLFWATIYAAGALCCGLAAVRPALLRRAPARAVLAVSLALALWGVIAFWPDAARWWSVDVWWPEASGEAAREGMGMMVLAAAVAAAAAVGMRRA